ncbi:hypothetical protein, partial [Mesorhizobium sp.]|uniref:hypothetical protein n=1 Tax=Mesorhizobium sp. TaxID=1871066 RepID=UPI00257CEA7A
MRSVVEAIFRRQFQVRFRHIQGNSGFARLFAWRRLVPLPFCVRIIRLVFGPRVLAGRIIGLPALHYFGLDRWERRGLV